MNNAWNPSPGEVVRTALGLAFERSLRIEDRPVGKAAAFGLAGWPKLGCLTKQNSDLTKEK
jgi:hypothetical protein